MKNKKSAALLTLSLMSGVCLVGDPSLQAMNLGELPAQSQDPSSSSVQMEAASDSAKPEKAKKKKDKKKSKKQAEEQAQQETQSEPVEEYNPEVERYKNLPRVKVNFTPRSRMMAEPIIQTKFTADPAPMVWNDTVYLYVTHDEEYARGYNFEMKDWLLYTSTDMVNWKEYGAVASLQDFSWRSRDNGAWAMHVVPRNGKFYMYCPLHGHGIGVLVADSPYGPFKDPIGKPIVWQQEHWDDIDPTVWIDDDGQAYMYWGNPYTYCIKLNEDMISTSGDIFVLNPQDGVMRPVKEEGSKINLKVPDEEKANWAVQHYQEGPWLWSHREGFGPKRWYMAYASTCCPEAIGYAMADSPMGPWKGADYIMAPTPKTRGNHPGIIEYRGHHYCFGLNYDILRRETEEHSERRSVSVVEMHYRQDGTIEQSPYFLDCAALNPLEHFNPYKLQTATTMANSWGVKSAYHGGKYHQGVYLTQIHNGDAVLVRDVDFGKGGRLQFEAKVAGLQAGAVLEVRIDNRDGDIIGRVEVPVTGGAEQWTTVTTDIVRVRGVHDIYFTFQGPADVELFNFDTWQFTNQDVQTVQVQNPWLWSDVPDPDIIRVGNYYYLVSTTMHLMPGAPIMRSADLVNWETVSYLFDKIHDTPRYDLEQGTVYGRGQWATSLRYHEFKSGPMNGQKLFFALFTSNDDPHKSWLYKTDDPAKGWTLVARLPHYHDASLFFDDDDRCYVYHDGSVVHLSRLTEDLTKPDPTWEVKTLNTRELMPEGLLEGSRAFKKDGYYYLSMISWPRSGRQQLAYRSRNIEGPYEMQVILKSKFGGWNYVGQGTVVEGKDGEWYGVIFQDRGGVGRVLTLSPCQWIDGWPMIGEQQPDGSRIVPQSMMLQSLKTDHEAKSPMQSNLTEGGYISIVHSDEFDKESTLNTKVPLWQWNHNPVDKAWSLKDRPGFLRLKTSVKASTLYHARNTLTQRMEGPTCAGTVRIEFANMKEGDRAGFAAFNGHSGIFTIERQGGKTSLVLTYEEVSLSPQEKAITDVKREEQGRIDLTGKTSVCLRITGDFRPEKHDNATFWYSLDDGATWQQMGGNYQMRFDFQRFFMGTKFAIFNYCTDKAGGYVDVDWFHYEH